MQDGPDKSFLDRVERVLAERYVMLERELKSTRSTAAYLDRTTEFHGWFLGVQETVVALCPNSRTWNVAKHMLDEVYKRFQSLNRECSERIINAMAAAPEMIG